jgi:hypothetical protein
VFQLPFPTPSHPELLNHNQLDFLNQELDHQLLQLQLNLQLFHHLHLILYPQNQLNPLPQLLLEPVETKLSMLPKNVIPDLMLFVESQ